MSSFLGGGSGGGGGGSPGGLDKQLQFNDNGVFGGVPVTYWDGVVFGHGNDPTDFADPSLGRIQFNQKFTYTVNSGYEAVSKWGSVITAGANLANTSIEPFYIQSDFNCNFNTNGIDNLGLYTNINLANGSTVGPGESPSLYAARTVSGVGTVTKDGGFYLVSTVTGGAVSTLWYGYYAQLSVGNLSSVGDAYGLYAKRPILSGATPGTIGNYFTVWQGDLTGIATNGYFLWYDSPGVFRVKADGVMAYYNPTFTKYTPGAVNFERIVQQWNSDVAEIGPEQGGTGVKRPLRLLGSAVEVPTNTFATLPASPTTGMMSYVSDSNTAVWGAVIAGGSTNKILAWYNGTAWTVVGK